MTNDVWVNRIVGEGEVAAGELVAHPQNWRKHPKEQAAQLQAGLGGVGWVQRVIVNRRTGRMLDGHLRAELARRQGEATPVPVVYVDLSEDEERTVLATLDPIAGMAIADEATLAGLVRSIEDADLRSIAGSVAQVLNVDVDGKGDAGADTEPQIDRAEELREKWGVQPGDLWQLGEHRLICGDCTDAAVVARVMGGERADMVFTSPPYNRGTTTGGGFNDGGLSQQLTNGYVGYSDDRSVDDYRAWQGALLSSWWEMLTDEGAIFYNHRPRVQDGIYETPLLWNPGLPLRQIVIWHSGAGINFAPTHYRVAHEWIMVFAKPGFRLVSKGASGVGDVWSVGVSEIDGHPAPFPVELVAIALRTTSCAIVYEPFSGSGTTLIACENLGRRCRAVEIAPGYVAVALERWATHTGKTPVRVEAG